MNILQLQTHDLFSYKDLDLKLDNLGLVLIEGENGAGKSNIFESLVWVLFGELLTKDRADDVVRIDHETSEPVHGESYGLVRLETDGKQIEIKRHRKHIKHKNKVFLFIENNDITGSSDSNTQEKINEVLQMDKETFLSTVMFPQEASRFANGTDAEQKAILDKLLCLERFAKAQEKKKKEASSLRLMMESIKSSITNTTLRIDELKTEIDNFVNLKAEFEEKREREIFQWQEKLDNLQAPEEDKTLQKKIDSLKIKAKRNEDASLAIDAANKEILRLQTEKSSLQAELYFLENAQKVSPEPKRPDRSEDEANELYNKTKTDLTSQEVKLQSTLRELAETRFKISERAETTVCWTCGQELSAEAKKKLFGDLDEKILELDLSEKSLRGQINASNIAIGIAEEDFTVARNYSNWLEDKKLAEQSIGRLQDCKNEIVAATSEIKDFEDLLDKAKELNKESNEARVKMAGLVATLDGQRSAREVWERERASLGYLLGQAQERENTYTPLIGDRQKRQKKLEYDLKAKKKYLEILSKSLEYIDFWILGFSNSGVKNFLLDAIVPTINDSLVQYLKLLTDGKATAEFATQVELASGESREKFHLKVKYSDGAKKYKNLSGGERRRVDIAVLFAMASLASSRSRAPVKMRLLDEVFDNLDSDGKEKVMELLRELVLPKVGTLLVMSHDDDLKSMFDNRIVVSKVNGVSCLN